MLKSWVHVSGDRVTIQRFVSLGSTFCVTGINVICATGKNINPRFRFKIKASYIVSTEGDVRRVTVLAIEAA